MPYTIAVAGKGGVGKTTLTGMMIQYLADKKEGPILAVDADANSNLNEVLGVDVEMTLGDIRDELSKAEVSDDSPIPKGMSKQDYTEFKFDSALVEEDDLIYINVKERRLEIVGVKGEKRTPEEMEEILKVRKAKWQPKPPKYTKGTLKLFSEHAVSPIKGGYMM